MQVVGGESDSTVAVVSNMAQKRLMISIINHMALDQSNRPIKCVDSFADVKSANATGIVICHENSPNKPAPVVPSYFTDQRIVVMSNRLDEETIVSTLNQGANYFFNIDEPASLLAVRINAALRQYHSADQRVLKFDPYTFFMSARKVELGGKAVPLNPKEFDCAYYLFANQNRIVSSEELMVSVWSLPAKLDSRRIDTATCRLRKKLELNGQDNGWCLDRVRGAGIILSKENSYSLC